jgi:hypothetical protein
VILKLLSHNLDSVREETYRLCQKRVVAAIGPRLNASGAGVPGSQILFLCRCKILVEMACHGLTSDNSQIRNHSEDILIHIIKCKILVSDEIWNKIVEALIGALPILLCHSDKTSSLGRCLLNISDPDTAQSLHLPKIEVNHRKCCCLFCCDCSSRSSKATSTFCSGTSPPRERRRSRGSAGCWRRKPTPGRCCRDSTTCTTRLCPTPAKSSDSWM